MKLIGDRVLLKPSVSEYRGMIAIPKNSSENVSTCEVLAHGKKTHPLIQEGRIVFAHCGSGERNTTYGENKGYLTKNANVFAILNKQGIVPLGRKLLILRDIREESTEGGIIIPENRRTQSLEGWIIRFGIPGDNKYFRPEVEIGDKIRLNGWEAHMLEVGIPPQMLKDDARLGHVPQRHGFGLIVNEKDLLFKWS